MAVAELGSIANKIFRIGDPTTEAGRDYQLGMLMAARDMEIANALTSIETSLVRLEAGRVIGDAETFKRVGDGVAALDAARTRDVNAWAEAGLANALPVWHVPGWLRALLTLLMAGLDFYIFANAISKALRASDDPGLPQFWLGGATGLLVFIVGVAMAHNIKNRSWLKVLAENDPQERNALWRESLSAGKTALVVMVTVYGLLTVVALGVRFGQVQKPISIWVVDPGARGEIAAIILFTLVPLVAVALEVALHDPLAPPPPMPVRIGLIGRIRASVRAKRHAVLMLRKEKVSEAIQKRYAFELDALFALQQQHIQKGATDGAQ
ncbi:MAG TPA: hypothetical protein PKI05_04980 [Thermogutta sp.]|nr:hypothetical protein [Thermogutta sp.]